MGFCESLSVGLEGNAYNIGLLNRRSICLRISEGNAKFYKVGTTGLHCKHDGDRGIACRITGRNECDEGRLALEPTFQNGENGEVWSQSKLTSAFFTAKTFLRISVITQVGGFCDGLDGNESRK